MSAEDKFDVEQGIASAEAEAGAGAEVEDSAATSDVLDRSADESKEIPQVELIDDGDEPPPQIDMTAVSEEKSTWTRTGPEIIHDNTGPFHPNIDQTAEPSIDYLVRLRKKEVVQIHDSDGPVHPSTFEQSIIDSKFAAGPNELSPPVPLTSFTYEDGGSDRKVQSVNMRSSGAPLTDTRMEGIETGDIVARRDNNIAIRANPSEDEVLELMNDDDVEEHPSPPTGVNRSNGNTSNVRESSIPGIVLQKLILWMTTSLLQHLPSLSFLGGNKDEQRFYLPLFYFLWVCW